MDELPAVDELVQLVEKRAVATLDGVGEAVAMADLLGARGDAVVAHFVHAARAAGCSWSQIGAEMGVSKQAAQQAFVAPARRRRFGRRPGSVPPPSAPSERLTRPARAVVSLAQQEAAALGHGYVGTEHLLLGILAEVGSVGATALTRLGVDAGTVRERVEAVVGLGPGAPPGLRMTPRTKKVLELARTEAARMHADLVGTEHVLLALTEEGEGLAAKILVELGADLARVRQTVLDLLSGAPGER